MSIFSNQIYAVTGEIAELLISKNKAYGNSALSPIRVFSSASPVEQLLVRIDDKLSRIRNLSSPADSEDTLLDLIGYLILLRVASRHNQAETTERGKEDAN